MVLNALCFAYVAVLAVIDMIMSSRWSGRTIKITGRQAMGYATLQLAALYTVIPEVSSHQHVPNHLIIGMRFVAAVYLCFICCGRAGNMRENVDREIEFTDSYVQLRYDRALKLIAASLTLAFVA